MVYTILSLAVVLSLSVHAGALEPNQLAILSSTISEDSCLFYDTLGHFQPCGSTGYVESFGLKYCDAYLAARSKFEDQLWQNSVRTCLQNTMMSNLRANTNATCEQIRQWGFDSHYGCYMHPIPTDPEVTFCKLPARDIAHIAYIARAVAFEKEVMAQFTKMVKECAEHHS